MSSFDAARSVEIYVYNPVISTNHFQKMRKRTPLTKEKIRKVERVTAHIGLQIKA